MGPLANTATTTPDSPLFCARTWIAHVIEHGTPYARPHCLESPPASRFSLSQWATKTQTRPVSCSTTGPHPRAYVPGTMTPDPIGGQDSVVMNCWTPMTHVVVTIPLIGTVQKDPMYPARRPAP